MIWYNELTVCLPKVVYILSDGKSETEDNVGSINNRRWNLWIYSKNLKEVSKRQSL